MINLKVRILVTGAAGSIGASALNSLKLNHELLGIDNYTEYYSPAYKHERVAYYDLNSIIQVLDICNYEKLKQVFNVFKPEIVIHLAARPGVRASFLNLNEYIESNIIGFSNLAKLDRKSVV